MVEKNHPQLSVRRQSDAHQKFLCYCQLENLKSVQFKEFKQITRELILERYHLGLSHDLSSRKVPAGPQA